METHIRLTTRWCTRTNELYLVVSVDGTNNRRLTFCHAFFKSKWSRSICERILTELIYRGSEFMLQFRYLKVWNELYSNNNFNHKRNIFRTEDEELLNNLLRRLSSFTLFALNVAKYPEIIYSLHVFIFNMCQCVTFPSLIK